MLKVQIKPERNFIMPVKGTEQAACYDVYASRIEHATDGMVICYLGFSTSIPEGYKGVVVPRSNITKYGWIMPNSPGQIDSDYRNEWQVRFRPLQNKTPFPYRIGERIAQIYFEKVEPIEFTIVSETDETKRGLGGFGHTGLK